MAKNKIEIDVEVKDKKGTTKKMGLESKKAADGMEKLANNSRTADRNIKGVAATSSSGTKNFSKMSQGIGGLVGAYATLAANVFAITAAFNFLKNAADFRVLQESQFAFATTTGKSLGLLTSKVQEATGGLLKFEEAAQAVSIGTAAGLSSKQLTGLADVAKKASMSLGRDLTDSFNRLTRGAIKAEPELLDELGIIIRLDKVTKDYAATLGKSAKDLTTFQKSQAVVNAVISQGETKFRDLGGEVNQVARLGKAFDDVLKGIKETLAPLAEFLGGVFANNITALVGAFALLGTGIAKSLGGVGPGAIDIADDARDAETALRGVGGSSKLGQKLTGGGELSDRDLNLIERSAKAKSSTIIRYDNTAKEAVVRNVRIMKAERQMQLAQTQTGVKRVYSMWRAELKLLQAQHGTTMGFMKAGMRGFGRVANKVLGLAGALGLLFTILGVVKQVIDSFRSDEFKEFVARNQKLSDVLDDQNTKIAELVNKFEGAKNFSDNIVANFELLNNLDLSAVEGLSLDRKDGQSINALRETNDIVEENFQRVLKTLQTQIQAFKAAGLKPPTELTAKTKELGIALELLGDQITSPGTNFERYNEIVDRVNNSVLGLNKVNEEAIEPLKKQRDAILGLNQTGEEFLQFQQKFAENSSKFGTATKIMNDLTTGLNEAGLTATLTTQIEKIGPNGEKFLNVIKRDIDKTFSMLSEPLQNALDSLLGEQEDSVTVQELLNKIAAKRIEIVDQENKIVTAQFKTQEKFTRLLREDQNPVRQGILKSQQSEENIQNKINKILGERNFLETINAESNDTAVKKEQAELKALGEQLKTQQEITRVKKAQESIELRLFNLGVDKQLNSAKQELLNLDQKSLNIAKEREKLEQGNRDRATEQAKRAFKRSSPFASLFQDKFDAAIELKQARDERDIKVSALAAERKMKEDLIEMEYTLLDAKLMQLQLEMELRAKDPTLNMRQQIQFAQMGKKVEARRGDLPGMKARALSNAELAETSGIAAIDEAIAKLIEKDNDLQDINVLTTSIAENLSSGMSQAFSAMVTGAKTAKQAFADMAKSILSNIAAMVAEMMVLQMIKRIFNLSFEGGGVMSKGKKVESYSTGGIARGPSRGYPAVLHGTEAVVPLPNGKSIPVEMKGAGGVNNNIVVNVSSDGQTTTQGSSGPDMDRLGGAIAKAVQVELQNQKRSGGILNPYGVA